MNCVTSSDYTLVTVYPSTYYITHRSLVMLFLHLKTSTAVITLWTPILNACGSLCKQMFHQRNRTFKAVHLKKIGKVW